MKTPIFFLALILSITSFSQITDKKNETKEVNVILMHPSVFILDAFDYLVNQKIIDIKGIHFTGVYFEKETYDYSLSEKWIEKYGNGLFELKKISGEISDKNIYSENDLTNEFKQLFDNSSAIIFTGGDDIQPSLYGAKTIINAEIEDPYRHLFELSFLFHLTGGSQNENFASYISKRPDYVCFGICLGMQTMNVAASGTLFQDIPIQVYNQMFIEDILESKNMHSNYYSRLYPGDSLSSGLLHEVKFKSGTNFSKQSKIFSDSTYIIYSSHHQAVEKPAKNFNPIAWSADGKVIEAIQHTIYPNVFGVQFHPEKISLYCDEVKHRLSPKEPAGSYKAFIENRQERNVNKSVWIYFSFLLK